MTIVPVNLSNQPPKKTFKDRVVTTSANVVGLGVGMAMPYTIFVSPFQGFFRTLEL